jgi:hypothetical protein
MRRRWWLVFCFVGALPGVVGLPLFSGAARLLVVCLGALIVAVAVCHERRDIATAGDRPRPARVVRGGIERSGCTPSARDPCSLVKPCSDAGSRRLMITIASGHYAPGHRVVARGIEPG